MKQPVSPPIRFIDLFCGIGGFRFAVEQAAANLNLQTTCVFSSDINKHSRLAYKANFGEFPHGDITKVLEAEVPQHDILLAGFPCQPFSIIGQMKGFEDTRGTLFFDIARILAAKKPRAFVLENVRRLVAHDGGRTLETILATLRSMGYQTDYRVLSALDFGLPQKRERIWIVGFLEPTKFTWPEGGVPMKPLVEVLEQKVPESFYASGHIRKRRLAQLPPATELSIWHENKSGHVCSRPYCHALRAGASYNYLLVNGERRLMSREMLRLQGFPESFKIVCSDGHTRTQAGNSLPVNVAEAVLSRVLEGMSAK